MTNEELKELLAKIVEGMGGSKGGSEDASPSECAAAIRAIELPKSLDEALRQENAELKAQLEKERMRLAGCATAALMNTEESVKDRISSDNPYWSASYGDICNAVDREIALRNENQQLKSVIDSARSAIEVLLDYASPPEANCSCHISPTCNDCINYGKQREDVEYVESIDKELCKALKGGVA